MSLSVARAYSCGYGKPWKWHHHGTLHPIYPLLYTHTHKQRVTHKAFTMLTSDHTNTLATDHWGILGTSVVTGQAGVVGRVWSCLLQCLDWARWSILSTKQVFTIKREGMAHTKTTFIQTEVHQRSHSAWLHVKMLQSLLVKTKYEHVQQLEQHLSEDYHICAFNSHDILV